MKFYPVIPKHRLIQLAKLQIDILNLNTTFCHWKKIKFRLLLNKGVQCIPRFMHTVFALLQIWSITKWQRNKAKKPSVCIIIVAFCCWHIWWSMTSRNRNVLRITGPLWWEATSLGGFYTRRSSYMKLSIFFFASLNKLLSRQSSERWFKMQLRWPCDVILILLLCIVVAMSVWKKTRLLLQVPLPRK